ncbi:MAG: mechanosensitive ion channel family protein [Planctomycetota bacterium]|nr:mechanosensitive ion channel family protein [Planctomycetota bacterium]
MRVHLLLPLLLFLAAPVGAQDGEEKPPEKQPEKPKIDSSGPRLVWRAFADNMGRKGDTGDESGLEAAGRLFDLSDVNEADRARVGRLAAIDLREFLQHTVDIYFHWSEPGPEYKEDTYAYKTEHGEIHMDRGPDGNWRFSKRTLENIQELASSVLSLPKIWGHEGGEEFLERSTFIRKHVPYWMRRRAFLLEHWQWLGVLALIIIGLIGSSITRFATRMIGRRYAKKKGVEISDDRRGRRPIGIAAMGVLWYLGVPFLALPETFDSIFITAARVVFMVGLVWSLCRAVDFIAEVLAGMAEKTHSKFDDLLVPMLRRAVKIFVFALGVIWIADNIGLKIAPLLAGLGIGGIAIALASKDTVENFFGAFSILVDRPFQVGDWIKMGPYEGTISEVGFRSSRIRTFYDSVITFPNAMLIRTAVDNMGRRQFRRIKETLGIAYDTPASTVEAFTEGIREIIRLHPYTRKDYYLVYFTSFGASTLNILVYCFVKCADWSTELREKQRLFVDILRLAQELNVEFAFPSVTQFNIEAHARDHSGIPDDVDAALRSGRSAARGIVETHTGDEMPPPATIQRGPSDAGDDDG